MDDSFGVNYTIPSYVQKLFRTFERADKKDGIISQAENKIEIGESISKLAFVYEKIRNAIDYKEEHLMKKNAIWRILKRRFVPGCDTNEIAEPLIKELILGGYAKNNTIPESQITKIKVIIDKYTELINHIYYIHTKSDRHKIYDWLISICACEIEEDLSYNVTERALIDFMFFTLSERIVLKNTHKYKDIRDIQIYISILKTLVRYDPDMISYNILRYYYPSWHNLTKPVCEEIAMHIYKIKFKIELQLNHPLAEQLNRLVRKYVPIFTILKDIIVIDPKKAFDLIQEPKSLDKVIKDACKKKYLDVRAKLKRTSFRSIIYIFLTKMMIALILEIPYELFIATGKIDYFPLSINIIFHPLLLFLIALVIRVPSDENTNKIIRGVKDIIYNYKGKNIKHYIKIPIKRGVFIRSLFQILYSIAYIITFGGIIFILYTLHFNIISMILFILFLSLVTFFGIKVRQGAQELLVLDQKSGMIMTIINFFSVPIIRAGRWMSVKFSKINFFVFFFDVIIEAPFKLLIEVFEDWSTYIKEKKEEIYDRD